MLGRTPPCAIVTCPRSLIISATIQEKVLVQFFVVPNGELKMTWDDTG
jgi:hypothetical protein